MSQQKNPVVYLYHIQDALKKILTYTSGMDLDAFLKNDLVQDAVIRNFEIMGEATKQLDHDFRNKHLHIQWKNIAGMRDKLIHDYIDVDLWAVWAVVEDVLPVFSSQIKEIIASET